MPFLVSLAKFLSRLHLAEARHMRCFSSVICSVNFCWMLNSISWQGAGRWDTTFHGILVYTDILCLMYSEWPKLYRALAILSAIGLIMKIYANLYCSVNIVSEWKEGIRTQSHTLQLAHPVIFLTLKIIVRVWGKRKHCRWAWVISKTSDIPLLYKFAKNTRVCCLQNSSKISIHLK